MQRSCENGGAHDRQVLLTPQDALVDDASFSLRFYLS